MSPDITVAAALFAGTVSFLSPCVLPLVPPYLVYLAGTSIERLADAEPEPRVRRETVAAAALFVNSIVESPQTSLIGLGLILLGLPAYRLLRDGVGRG